MMKSKKSHLTVVEELTDGELMSRLADGHNFFLGELYARHGNTVLRILTYILGSSVLSADVEDLCHDVFIKVLKGSQKYTDQGKFPAWIASIAVKEARAHGRKNLLRRKLFDRFVKENNQTTLTTTTETPVSIDKSNLMKQFEGLTHSHKEILVLAVAESMTGAQIADVLNISHNAARAKLFRARQALKKLLNNTESDSEIL